MAACRREVSTLKKTNDSADNGASRSHLLSKQSGGPPHSVRSYTNTALLTLLSGEVTVGRRGAETSTPQNKQQAGHVCVLSRMVAVQRGALAATQQALRARH